MATASDSFVAAEKIKSKVPDVIALDVEMPRMDGITFLEKIMSQHPIPVVMCSSLTEKGAATTLRALDCGAVEIIQKPRLGAKLFLEESRALICDAVKAASMVRPKRRTHLKVTPKLTADAIMAKPVLNRAMLRTTGKVIAVGASTGGTEALRLFLESLPPDAPGIVIVQHMPEGFTRSFASA
jgi:two-component system chemotaxis response regulator CheB